MNHPTVKFVAQMPSSSGNGKTYSVILFHGVASLVDSCTCPDHYYGKAKNGAGHNCKHVLAARLIAR